MKTTILFVALSLGIAQAHASGGSGNREKRAPVVRNILSNQLPARLLTTIKKNYKDYWITDLRKESLNGKVSYYITLENADQQIRLNTTHSAGWSVSRIISKDIAAR